MIDTENVVVSYSWAGAIKENDVYVMSEVLVDHNNVYCKCTSLIW